MNHEYHSDARGLVFNVKVRKLPDVPGATEEQCERAYEDTGERWWNEAREIAKRHGFDDIYSCGRSSGYAYPTIGRHAVTADTLADDKELRARFEAFGEELGELLKFAPTMYRNNLEQIIGDDAEAASEDADAIALIRDIAATAVCSNSDPDVMGRELDNIVARCQGFMRKMGER